MPQKRKRQASDVTDAAPSGRRARSRVSQVGQTSAHTLGHIHTILIRYTCIYVFLPGNSNRVLSRHWTESKKRTQSTHTQKYVQNAAPHAHFSPIAHLRHYSHEPGATIPVPSHMHARTRTHTHANVRAKSHQYTHTYTYTLRMRRTMLSLELLTQMGTHIHINQSAHTHTHTPYTCTLRMRRTRL